MEVDRVRVGRSVDEPHPEQVSLAAAQGRARDPPVVDPGGVMDARGDLALLVARDQRPLAKDAAAREAAGLPPIEVAEDLGRVEAVGRMVDGLAGAEGRARRAAA